MRKNPLFLAVSVALLTACSNDIALDSGTQSAEVVDNAIGFQFINRNSITSRGNSTPLNNAGHYNFGVFAYKLSGTSSEEVMKNYLVGYGPSSSETPKNGYYLTNTSQTTYGSGDGKSLWAYEKLGNKEYSYTGSEGYYQSSDDGKGFYESNNANQYLKYWDKSSSSVDFFGYAPYINGDSTTVYDNTNHSLSFHDMNDGYDDASKYDYLAAYTNVKTDNYGQSVQLNFNHICSMVQIAFYEEIEGYSVKILNLQDANDGNAAVGVSAAPAKKKESSEEGKSYDYGTLYKTGYATVKYLPPSGGSWPGAGSPEVTVHGNKTYSQETKDHLTFVSPNVESIGTSKSEASYSPTKYYLIPDNDKNESGLTFHVTYQLTAEDTGETITVYNATVHVPYKSTDETVTYCNWLPDHSYTYIFKITKGSSGSTDKPENIDPSDPEADDSKALSPIIFDNCVVNDWATEIDSEHDIN